MLENVIYRSKVPDTSEYLRVNFTGDVTLDAQPVRFSFDRTTWLDATWVGSAGTTRTAHLLMTDANLPTDGVKTLYVRVTDNPETPIINAGILTVK